MTKNKKDQFKEESKRIAALAKAVAHPARIEILNYLYKSKSCICGDIVEQLPLSQSTVSQHLKELKRVGLIQGSIDGPRVCYCIDFKVWGEMRLLLNNFLKEKPEDCC